MPIILIAAVADNGVIGAQGALPWRSAEDLRRFRDTTMGHACLMGRKTWEGLEGPLRGRRNLVLTRQENYGAPGAEVVHDLEALLDAFEGAGPTLFVCGGGEVYRAALPRAEELLLTLVHLRPKGEVLFPEIPVGAFEEISRLEGRSRPRLSFARYRRRRA